MICLVRDRLLLQIQRGGRELFKHDRASLEVPFVYAEPTWAHSSGRTS